MDILFKHRNIGVLSLTLLCLVLSESLAARENSLEPREEDEVVDEWRQNEVGMPLNPKYPLSPKSFVKVKIFPHKVAYPPHGRDQVDKSLVIKAPSSCRVYKGHPRRAASIGAPYKTSRTLTYLASQLKNPVYLRCKGLVTLVRKKPLVSFNYQGSFYIHRNRDGAVEVINLIGLQQYLRGVVPSEVFSGWPMEALKAQAVAARTYAIFHLTQSRLYRRRLLYDVDDTIAFQAYTGASFRTLKTDRAVRETEGQILTFGGRVIQAYYHADSGGQTEDADNVWHAEVPYCKGRKEAFETEKPTNAWKLNLSFKQLSYRLRRAGLIPSRSNVTHIVVPAAGRTESGRVKSVAVTLRGGKLRAIPYTKFSKAIGRHNFQSSLFDFTRKANGRGVTVQGLGFGHGVGMNQMGALHLAGEKSWTYDQILNFYYSGVDLCALDQSSKDVKGCYPEKETFKPRRIFTGTDAPQKNG